MTLQTLVNKVLSYFNSPFFYILVPLVLISSCAFILVYAIFLDGQVIRKPLTVLDTLCVTEKEYYYPGELVYGQFSIIKNRALRASVQWYLVDTFMFPYVEQNSNIPLGFSDKLIPIEKIPISVTPGVYYFLGTVVYRLNDFNSVNYTFRSNSFIVYPLE